MMAPGKGPGCHSQEVFMNVENAGEKYRCEICGNEVEVLTAGGGELVCCGEPMIRME